LIISFFSFKILSNFPAEPLLGFFIETKIMGISRAKHIIAEGAG
jgi:hypothetical protein